MPKYITERVFKLDFLGEQWKDCFIKFSSVSMREAGELMAQKLTDKPGVEIAAITLEFFKKHFLSGAVYDSETKQIVSLKVEDFDLLPNLIQEKAVLFLVGDATQ